MAIAARRLAGPLLVLGIGLAALGTAAYLTLIPETRIVSPVAIGGPFRLVAQDEREVTDKDFLGTPHLVFFGFTHCP
ncbi:MAG: SCO family protein, partial [Methylobacteriaceae bacterium]|nr:SCO family protein [Methylobacteriaceae bacterium]